MQNFYLLQNVKLYVILLIMTLTSEIVNGQRYPYVGLHQSPASLCSPGYVTLTAENYGDRAGEFYWCTTASGGSPVHIGYVESPQFGGSWNKSTYSFYVRSCKTMSVSFLDYSAYCQTARSSQTATVSPPPPVNFYTDIENGLSVKEQSLIFYL